MTIKETYLKAEPDTQKFWRGLILRNYSLIQTWLWFNDLESPRPAIKTGDEVLDDGKPVENIHFEDICKLANSLHVGTMFNSIELRDFLDWFLDLETDAFYEEDENGWSSWISFEYMARAYNHYILENTYKEDQRGRQ